MELSIAPTSQQTYSSGEKRFVNFINLYKRKQVEECLPASEPLLTVFVAFLVKSIKYASIKTYLAAVRHFHIRRGIELNLNKMLRLQLVLRGIKRSQGQQLRIGATYSEVCPVQAMLNYTRLHPTVHFCI
jgi:hypothetical protein